MKKIIISDFMEYNNPYSKLGNYHYANCFANDGYEVLWISNPFNNLVYFKDKEDYKYKKSISKPICHKLAHNIYGFAPRTKRMYGNYPLSRDAKRVLEGEKYIKPNPIDSLTKLKFNKVDILWISNPKHYWLINVVEYNKLVVRIPDDFQHMSAWPKSVIEIENALIDKADLIIVTSEYLIEKVKKRGRTPICIKNGVDTKLFSKASKLPEEYRNIQNKIVYVGAIAEWFDIDLVLEMAKRLPTYNFFIIGKTKINLESIYKLSNVFILGPKDYKEIPDYLINADVGIIPFKVNELTDAVSPLKLYEYCAAGLPVVSTGMKEVKALKGPIYVSNNNEEFIEFIVKATNSSNSNKDELICFAEENSWTSKYQFILKTLYNK